MPLNCHLKVIKMLEGRKPPIPSLQGCSKVLLEPLVALEPSGLALPSEPPSVLCLPGKCCLHLQSAGALLLSGARALCKGGHSWQLWAACMCERHLSQLKACAPDVGHVLLWLVLALSKWKDKYVFKEHMPAAPWSLGPQLWRKWEMGMPRGTGYRPDVRNGMGWRSPTPFRHPRPIATLCLRPAGGPCVDSALGASVCSPGSSWS